MLPPGHRLRAPVLRLHAHGMHPTALLCVCVCVCVSPGARPWDSGLTAARPLPLYTCQHYPTHCFCTQDKTTSPSLAHLCRYGTDAYLHLNRLGNSQEPLP